MDEKSLIEHIGSDLRLLKTLFGKMSHNQFLVFGRKEIDLEKFPIENIPAITRKLSDIQSNVLAYMGSHPHEDIDVQLKNLSNAVIGLKSLFMLVWHNIRDHGSPRALDPDGRRYIASDADLQQMIQQKSLSFTNIQLRKRIFADFFGQTHMDTRTDLQRNLPKLFSQIFLAVKEIRRIEKNHAEHAELWLSSTRHAA